MGGTSLDIVIDGNRLKAEALYGADEMSTCWPGGSDQLSWASANVPARRYRGGETVAAYFGAACVWAGHLLEPDPSQDQMTATGAFREAADWAALDAGIATDIPDDAIDRAIADGLRWTRPNTVRSTAIKIDLTQGPVFLDVLLDTFGENNGVRWGVNPMREVYAKADDTLPTYQTLPLDGGLGYALDNYASTLIGRYFDSGTSTYETVTVTDTVAETNHGHVEKLIDLTNRGPISAGTATNHLDGFLALGAAVPQWTTGAEFAYGEILTMGGTAVALETVAAGSLLRVQGSFELAQRLNGQMYLDVPIGRTTLSGGTLKVDPLGIAVRNLADFVASVPA